MRLDNNQAGFSLTELIITMTVFGLVMGSIGLFFQGNLGIANETQVKATLESNARVAARAIQEDIQLAAQARQTNSIVDFYKPTGWNAVATNPGVLILESIAINTNDEVMIDAGTFIALKNNIIFYISGNKLYRRTLANTTVLPGQTNAAKTTCPPGTGGGCPDDKLLLENVSSFSVEHYDAGNNGPSGITPDAATATKVFLELTKGSIRGDVNVSYQILGTQRNTQ